MPILKNRNIRWLTKPRNLLIITIAILLLGTLGFILLKEPSASQAKPTVSIDRTYDISARLKDKRIVKDASLKIRITDAQIAKSILVQGKVARPVQGKVFLVINMEIENTYKIGLYAFPVDLVRFVREDGQKFAPSVHQGTVEIRPQATKKSNVAFVVLPTDKKFKIEIGEIGKEKETLEITF